ncbi:MAG: dephospho-CoA kinase [Sphingobacteriales bacterium]|nr:dephospho-CoA kinase [Sphingobacteriales bacterium]
MKKIGITGGIGSGKTKVCEFFEELGIPVYYSDIQAKSLMNTNSKLINKIISTFGEKSYINNVLNKEYLSEEVFNNPEKLKTLNSIVHPFVIEDFQHWCLSKNNYPYVIIESALLVETGLYKTLDLLICVVANEEEKIKRIAERDKLSREKILKRMENQMNDEEKSQYADFVIVSGDLAHVKTQVQNIHDEICKRLII